LVVTVLLVRSATSVLMACPPVGLDAEAQAIDRLVVATPVLPERFAHEMPPTSVPPDTHGGRDFKELTRGSCSRGAPSIAHPVTTRREVTNARERRQRPFVSDEE